MTENQIRKSKTEQEQGVLLSDRFVHRDCVNDKMAYSYLFATPDEIFKKLTEHFMISELDASSVSLGQDVMHCHANGATIEEMPRFQRLLRDGLQVPKEGNDGTGN